MHPPGRASLRLAGRAIPASFAQDPVKTQILQSHHHDETGFALGGVGNGDQSQGALTHRLTPQVGHSVLGDHIPDVTSAGDDGGLSGSTAWIRLPVPSLASEGNRGTPARSPLDPPALPHARWVR